MTGGSGNIIIDNSGLTTATNKTLALSANGLTGSLLRRGVLRQLAQLKHGQLMVVEDGEQMLFGTPGSALLGEVHVLDPALWGMVASSGSIGAGEAFIHGYWSSPDLTAVVRVFVSNLDVLDAMEGGLARLGGRLAVVHRHVPAGARQRERDLAAQAFARAGHEHGARCHGGGGVRGGHWATIRGCRPPWQQNR